MFLVITVYALLSIVKFNISFSEEVRLIIHSLRTSDYSNAYLIVLILAGNISFNHHVNIASESCYCHIILLHMYIYNNYSPQPF